MNRIFFVFLNLICFVEASEQDVLMALPGAEDAGIRVAVEVTRTASFALEGGEHRPNIVGPFRLSVFLRNESDKSLIVPLGDRMEETVTVLESPIVYSISAQESIGGALLKPSISDLHLVELAPGELTRLPVIELQADDLDSVERIDVIYTVDENIGRWFSTWSGRVHVVIER